METQLKFVEFEHFCPLCKHKDEPETDDTCDECLTEPVNEFSHKPVNWEKGE